MKTFVAVVIFLFSSAAWADGAVIKTSDLFANREAIALKVSEARQHDPEVFRLAAAVDAYKPSVYLHARGRRPYIVARAYRQLGARALWALVDLAAFHTPVRGDESDDDWNAMRIGLIDALAAQKEPLLEPVFRAAFNPREVQGIAVAAAMGLAHLGDAALAPLFQHAVHGDALFVAAVRGLGESHRPAAMTRLSALLDSAPNDPSAAELAQAMSECGSPWAWGSGSQGSKADGESLRMQAQNSLKRNASRFHGEGAAQITIASHRLDIAPVAAPAR